MRIRLIHTAIVGVVFTLVAVQAGGGCSATQSTGEGFGGSMSDTSVGPEGPGQTGTGGFNFGGMSGTSSTGSGGDPKTCQEAAANKTYLGCDFWPTVVANQVWSIFDYAVVVANAGAAQADVKVERNGQMVGSASIAPDSLAKIYLPWVPELKGPDFGTCTEVVPYSNSVRVNGGAYHLTSTLPVTVYQFSALEYEPQGGPPNKDWSACPAPLCPGMIPCASFSNDASLLLPSTAMTGNYRITGQSGWQLASLGAYFTITGTQPNTSVTAYISGTGQVLGGNGVQATGPNGKLTFNLNAGDVVQVLGDPNSDLAGSLVQASAPVQVISGMPCVFQPFDSPACDHIEESVLPAETLGKHYFVTVPSSPHQTVYGAIMRIYGNVDGTKLTYPSGAAPGNAPTTINAGQVVDLGVVMQSFEIQGDHEFAVATFSLAATLVDPNDPPLQQEGDPDQSQAVAVEQYRKKYVFLAPTDYQENYVDVIQPLGAVVTLDGAAIGAAPMPIGNSNYGVARVALASGQNGAHVIESASPFGIQVMGYGAFTSYTYPGGLNLDTIAPPPPPPK